MPNYCRTANQLIIITYCKQSCGGKKNHCFGFILLSLSFTGMFESYLLSMFWAHSARKLKYNPPDGSGRTRLVFPPDFCLKHDDNLVPFFTTKTCCSCFFLRTTLGQPRYFQKRLQPVLFLLVDIMWEKEGALKSQGRELCYAQWPQVSVGLFFAVS